MGALDDKVVVFTGCGAGIGRATLTRFVAEGAKVVAVDILPAVETLPADLGDAVVAVQGDVSDWEVNRRAARTAVETWGRIDVFVGNAGIFDGMAPLEEIEGERLSQAFHELYAVNVLGPLLGVRACADQLIERGGSVIITGSFAGANTGGGGILYTSSKHALHGVIRQLAYELAPTVRVNGVAPGVAATQMRGITSLGQTSGEAVIDGTREVLPLQEVPDFDAYAAMYTLLASDEAAAMTGSIVTIDSGLGIRGIAKPGGRVGR
ncbi:3-phenylpropionate-dihydrodiol/cinnamic acid-dihydrodiol dehydrogenase [Nocardioides sp. AN3]